VIRCVNHPVRHADYHCATCQVGLCKDCVNIRPFDRGRVQLCTRCQNGATDLGSVRPVPPFWTRIVDIVIWPLTGDSWMNLVVWALVSLVFLGLASFARMAPNLFGLIGMIGCYLIYYGLLISYFYRIISNSEDGKFKVPEFSEFPGIGGSFLLIVNFVIASLAVFWPAIAMIVGGSFLTGIVGPSGAIVIIGGLVMLIPGILLIPMAILVMGIFKNIAYVVNPLFLISQIKKIAKEYFIAVALMVGILMMYTFVKILFVLITEASLFVKVVLFPLDGVLQLYLFMVVGHLLGYLAYQTRFKLKWWPDCQEEPVFVVGGQAIAAGMLAPGAILPGMGSRMSSSPGPAQVAGAAAVGGVAMAGAAMAPPPPGAPPGYPPQPGAPAPNPMGGYPPPLGTPGPLEQAPTAAPGMDQEGLARSIGDGMAMLDHGRYEEALTLFKQILDTSPNHLGALRGVVMACIRLNDLEAARGFAQRQGSALAAQQMFDQLWEMYTGSKKAIPDLVLLPKDLFNLARWLIQQDKALESAKTLRELGVSYPDDPMASKALYQCAEILWRRTGKPDAALQMFEYIMKRYPDSPFRDQISIAINEIKAGAG